MDRETIEKLVDEQLNEVRDSALCRACGWEIEQTGLAVNVAMRPRSGKGASFLLRATFEDFPRQAPSCIFVNSKTQQPSDASWPPNVRHGAAPPGICTPGTREFHDHYHQHDRQYPWSAEKYPFLQTLMEIHRLMERGLRS
jgi:hypothetical protein